MMENEQRTGDGKHTKRSGIEENFHKNRVLLVLHARSMRMNVEDAAHRQGTLILEQLKTEEFSRM